MRSGPVFNVLDTNAFLERTCQVKSSEPRKPPARRNACSGGRRRLRPMRFGPKRQCQRKLHDAVIGSGYGANHGQNDQPFRWFNSSPEVIRLVAMMYVRCPLSLRNVEDLLFEQHRHQPRDREGLCQPKLIGDDAATL